MTEPETPDQALARSVRALNQGHADVAVAAALQGILQLQIVQHLQALGMAEEGQGESPEEKALAAMENPFGECAAGHEEFDPFCKACRIDAEQVERDTLPVGEPRER